MKITQPLKKSLSWSEMDFQQQKETLDCMRTGGSFVSAIADAIFYADSTNLKKITSAIPELICAFQPESASREVAVSCETIGRVALEAQDVDQYLLIKVADDVTTSDVQRWLKALTFNDESDAPGAYFCTSTACLSGLGEREFVGVVHHRFNS